MMHKTDMRQDIEKVLLTEEELAARIRELGAELTEEGKRLLKAYRDYTAVVECCCTAEFQKHFGFCLK